MNYYKACEKVITKVLQVLQSETKFTTNSDRYYKV